MANHPNRRKGYGRSSTDWHTCTDALGRKINYITSDEATVISIAVCSIHAPGSNEPSFRRVATGDVAFNESDEPIPSHGLIVLGRSKFDRPSLDDVRAMIDIDGPTAVAAVLADQQR